MKIGTGIEAEILLIDDESVIYKYASYNKKIAGYANERMLADGLVSFKRSCFKNYDCINYPKYLKKGLIKVENSFNCWYEADGYDTMALKFIGRVMEKYRMEHTIPQKLAIHY